MRSLREDLSRTVLAGGAATVGLALAARIELGLSALYPLKAAAGFGLMATIALAGIESHHPFLRVGVANHITMVRAALVALLLGLMGELVSATAAGVVVAVSLLAAILDGVDGWLARRTRMGSAFGARFDMEVDALLILVLAMLVWQTGRAGGWVVWSGLLRYAFVAAGWIWPWMRRPLPESGRRKAICVVQIGVLILAMAPVVPAPLAWWTAGVGLFALVYSFVVDTAWLWRSHR